MNDLESLLLSLWHSVEPFTTHIVVLVVILFIVFSRLGRIKRRSSKRQQFKMHHKATVNELKSFRDLSYKQIDLMSEPEISFFIKLKKAFPDYFIFPQIGASALIDLKSQPFNRSHFFSALNWIDTARVDFTLCDSDGRVVALIELDDASHDNKKERDEARNYIYRRAGYQLFSFDCRRMPNVAIIRETISKGLR